jgi:hypothetical protein
MDARVLRAMWASNSWRKRTMADEIGETALGPSAVSPIMSTLDRFRDEYDAYIAKAEPVSTTVPVAIRPKDAAGV